MSSCLSSGGRTYALDLEMIKSTSTTSTITSHTSSPSSTLSESSNSGLTICTRKQRTPRKRPNQTYNEAATLLSTVYPNIFSTKHLTKPHKSTKPIYESFSDQSSDLLLPFQVTDNSCFLLRHSITQEKPSYQIEPKVANCFEKQCLSQGEFDSHTNSSSIEMCNNYPEDDFDAESILDEEIEEGIDSIMGNLSVNTDTNHESNGHNWNWNPMGFGYGGRVEVGMGMGMRKGGVRAMRQVDEGNWWNFPTVDMLEISPRFNNKPQQASNLAPAMAEIKKKKKKKVETRESNSKLDEKLPNKENNNSAPISKPSTGLLLKLNYDDVLNSWSDKGTPFSDDVSVSDSPGNDVSVRLAQIDLFPEAGAVREASVMRYKEKRRTRLFSKKIRYQVRKVNADRRPRMKGRFVRRPNSSTGGQR